MIYSCSTSRFQEGIQMQQKLTPAGQNIVNDLSNRYNLSQDAVIHMIVAVSNGARQLVFVDVANGDIKARHG